MKSVAHFFTLVYAGIVLSCSGLKLDKDSNCINQSSGCFRADKTPPEFRQAVDPLPYLPGNNTISTLAKVDIMFSEELNNPKTSDFIFSGPGTGTSGIKVNAIEKIDKYTYRLLVSASLETGNIFLDFPNLKDYNGNPITGNTQINYYGNVDIAVPFTVNRNGLSSSSGYSQIDVNWSYTYVPPTASTTIYTVKLTNGSTDCNTASALAWSGVGTPIPSPAAGSTVTSGTSYSFSIDTNDVTTSGDQVLLICVSNATHNKRGTAAISFLQNSSAPTTTLSPTFGPSGSPKALTFTCAPYMDKIIYSSDFTSGNGVDPLVGSPTDPTFNAATGAVTSGSLYDAASKPLTPYIADPTHSRFEFRCIDRAGNIEAIKNSGNLNTETYVVDSTLPEVTITHVYRATTTREITGLSNKALAHQSADIIWHTNQVTKPFSLRKGSTSCLAADGTLVTSGTTPGVANQDITTTISYNSSGIAVGTNDLRLCVQNGGSYGQDTRTIIRTTDNHTPTTTVNVGGGSYGTVQNIVVTCNDTNPEGVIYDASSADGATVPTPPTGPLYSPIGVRISGLDHLSPITLLNQKTTTINWRCIDVGGNESTLGTATYTIDSVIPLVNVTYFERPSVSNLAGAYPSVQMNWTTDKPGLQYEIRNSGNCNGGFGGGGTATRYSGTAAASNSQNLSIASGDFPVVGNTYNIKVCVFNAANIAGYQTTANDVTRDETRPVIGDPSTTNTPVNSTNFTISWNAASDNVGVAAYRIFRSVTSGVYGSTPDYTAVSTSTTLTMPDTQKYFLRVVPIDAAGNVPVTPANYTEISTKPDIRLIISGLSGTIKINDGAQADQSFAANIPGPGSLWNTPLTLGQNYAFSITQQPAGQLCAIREKQFGSLSGDLTITVNCAVGYITGGTYLQIPPAPVNYMLYRGRASTDVARSVSGVSGAFVSSGIAITSSGTSFVTDPGTSQIYRISGSSLISVAGNGSIAGIADGNGAAATFHNPSYISSDGTNIYISQVGSSLGSNTNDGIRKLDPAGNVTTLVSGAAVLDPEGIVVLGNTLYWANRNSHQVKALDITTGVVSVFAGTGTLGASDGPGSTATFNQPMGLTALGGKLYVTEFGNHRIRVINISSQAVSTLMGSSAGAVDGTVSVAKFNGPSGITTDGFDLYVTDYIGRTVRRIRLDRNGGSNHIASTIVGSGATGGANGIGTVATFTGPVAIATNGRQLFVSDEGNGTIRKIADWGAVGYWPNNFGNQQEYASDIGSPLTGSLTGSISDTSTADRYNNAGGAQNLQGAEYVTASATGVTGTACNATLAAWYKPSSLAASQGIAYNGNSGNSGFGLMFDATTGIRGLLGGVVWIPAVGNSFMPPLNQWTHVTLRCSSGNRWTLFINGHKLADSVNSPLSNPLGQMTIGRDTISAYVNGSVTDIRLYNRSLDEGEINELAQDASTSIAVTGISRNAGATGLLTHFEMDNGSLADSGAINTPIVSSNGTLVTGKDGDTNGAYSFSAASSQYQATSSIIADGASANGEITVAAWVSPTALPSVGSVYLIASHYSASDTARGYYFEYFNNGGTQQLYWTPSGGSGAYTTNISMPLNTWSHVAVTHTGTTATIYVNGQAMPTAQVSPRPLAQTTVATPIYVGRRDDGLLTDGKVDDVRIYNNALSAWQIRQLATNIPTGLVARYDFTGDRSDISGFGQDLSNNGANLGTDRFGLANAAATFNGSSNFDGAMANFPLGNSPRTVCAWTNPTALSAAFSEVVMYGVNGTSQGWGFGMDGSATPPYGRMFILDTAGDLAYNLPHGLNVWRHMCATYSGATEQLFVDGTAVASKPVTLATASGTLKIGRGIFAGADYFTGSIDDVRIYNRALTNTEIQTLLQQPNKRIVLSGPTMQGDMGGSPSGINGADQRCPGGYKALIVDGAVRRACTSPNCTTSGISENIQWVIRPNITYLRGDLFTIIGTANFNGIVPLPLTTSITGAADTAWTGLEIDWTTNSNTCGDWSSIGSLGQYGSGSSTGGFSISTTSTLCLSALSVYCVEQ